MKPILEDLDAAVEGLESAEQKADSYMGTQLMVREQLVEVRELRDRVRRIVEED